jgi:hypothetical protein
VVQFFRCGTRAVLREQSGTQLAATRGQAAAGRGDVTVLTLREAASRLRADHEILLAHVADLGVEQLAAGYRLASGPLGDSCESLHDLVAHVLMWDEINLAVLTEAQAGRVHWSLDPRWETPVTGGLLNRAGVLAGRQLPALLLLHRFVTVRDALLAEFGRMGEQEWSGAGPAPVLAGGIGALAQRVWTVPGQPAFWHSAIHLNKLPAAR